MSELKTLKDLFETDSEADRNAIFKELKSEAVKWIKYGMDFNSKLTFMQFFNLTEEDLK